MLIASAELARLAGQGLCRLRAPVVILSGACGVEGSRAAVFMLRDLLCPTGTNPSRAAKMATARFLRQPQDRLFASLRMTNSLVRSHFGSIMLSVGTETEWRLPPCRKPA